MVSIRRKKTILVRFQQMKNMCELQVKAMQFIWTKNKNILPRDLNSDICDVRQSVYLLRETSFIKTAAQIDLGFKGEKQYTRSQVQSF